MKSFALLAFAACAGSVLVSEIEHTSRISCSWRLHARGIPPLFLSTPIRRAAAFTFADPPMGWATSSCRMYKQQINETCVVFLQYVNIIVMIYFKDKADPRSETAT